MTDTPQGGQPITPLAEDADTRHAVWNKTLQRWEGGTFASKSDASAHAKQLREGKRQGHQLVVRQP